MSRIQELFFQPNDNRSWIVRTKNEKKTLGSLCVPIRFYKTYRKHIQHNPWGAKETFGTPPWRGKQVDPSGNRGEILSRLGCYFSWPTSKVSTPNARVVWELCLLSMCHRQLLLLRPMSHGRRTCAKFLRWWPGNQQTPQANEDSEKTAKPTAVSNTSGWAPFVCVCVCDYNITKPGEEDTASPTTWKQASADRYERQVSRTSLCQSGRQVWT